MRGAVVQHWRRADVGGQEAAGVTVSPAQQRGVEGTAIEGHQAVAAVQKISKRCQQGRLFAGMAHEKLAHYKGQTIRLTVRIPVLRLECADPDHKGVDAGAAAQAGALDVQKCGSAEIGATLQPVSGAKGSQNRRIAFQQVAERKLLAQSMRLALLMSEWSAMPGNHITVTGAVFDNFAGLQRFDWSRFRLPIGRWRRWLLRCARSGRFRGCPLVA